MRMKGQRVLFSRLFPVATAAHEVISRGPCWPFARAEDAPSCFPLACRPAPPEAKKFSAFTKFREKTSSCVLPSNKNA